VAQVASVFSLEEACQGFHKIPSLRGKQIQFAVFGPLLVPGVASVGLQVCSRPFAPQFSVSKCKKLTSNRGA